jgi:type I pantothenate kinase
MKGWCRLSQVDQGPPDGGGFSPYLSFTRAEWARLRGSTPLTLTEADLDRLRGINEQVSLEEVADIYLPLSRLLNLYVAATRDLHQATRAFLGQSCGRVPYIIGIAGSVAVGKSTVARVLQVLLSRWPDHRRVDLVTTDGFLYPNRVLQERGLMHRKGFPESYDTRRLIRFLADLKSGRAEVNAPVYSHHIYDIVRGARQVVRRPDIVLLEGLNVLQPPQGAPVGVSDFFDFSIYVDADERHIARWYVERFLTLVRTAFRDPTSYFHRYADLPLEEAAAVAEGLWRDINSVNLRENILPTRERATLILTKGEDHSVITVKLRKL